MTFASECNFIVVSKTISKLSTVITLQFLLFTVTLFFVGRNSHGVAKNRHTRLFLKVSLQRSYKTITYYKYLYYVGGNTYEKFVIIVTLVTLFKNKILFRASKQNLNSVARCAQRFTASQNYLCRKIVWYANDLSYCLNFSVTLTAEIAQKKQHVFFVFVFNFSW